VFRRSAPLNGMLAKKTQNVSQPSKTAKRSAEQAVHAGLSVFPLKEVKPLSISPNVLKSKDVWECKIPSLNVCPSLVFHNKLNASTIDNVPRTSINVCHLLISILISNVCQKNQRTLEFWLLGTNVQAQASAFDQISLNKTFIIIG
jgi:hypothetical protein